jgi:hypothetical protein
MVDDLLRNRSSGCTRHWSEQFGSAYLDCPPGVEPFHPVRPRTEDRTSSQTWFDDANSTRLKVAAAKAAKLGGVGVFTAENAAGSAELWKALLSFKL